MIYFEADGGGFRVYPNQDEAKVDCTKQILLHREGITADVTGSVQKVRYTLFHDGEDHEVIGYAYKTEHAKPIRKIQKEENIMGQYWDWFLHERFWEDFVELKEFCESLGYVLKNTHRDNFGYIDGDLVIIDLKVL